RAHPRDPVKLRGEARYQHLVALCRKLGVITPEDPYPVWTGAGGPAVIVPLFLLYDYTFRPDGTSTKAEALDLAYRTGVIGADERHLHPDPYPSREAWCQARIDATLPRLRSEEHTSEPQSRVDHVCRLLLRKQKNNEHHR